jgi:hypothetical protein
MAKGSRGGIFGMGPSQSMLRRQEGFQSGCFLHQNLKNRLMAVTYFLLVFSPEKFN